MLDRENFDEQIQTALAHLYDHPFLQAHPLALPLGTRFPLDTRGRVLRRLLLDALQELKPPSDAPSDLPAWRHYQYLYMRYVEAKPVAELAGGLAVTERQTRRRHREALAAVATVLWDRWIALATPAADAGQPTVLPGGPRDGQPLDTELERIEAAHAAGTVDLIEVADGALAIITRLAGARGVVVSFTRSTAPALVTADRVVLRQVILGALTHCIQRAPEGRVEVSARTGGDRITLEIRAPGAQRLPPDPEPESGWDLAEIERLLRTQRGALEVEVEVQALTVRVVLPTAQSPTVLIVDDNPDALQLFRRYLGGGAYRVLEARTGDEAIQLAREHHLHCIVLDVMMPSRDGWEVLQALRGHPGTQDVPVIICSVLRQRELALSLGADGFLAKPVSQQALLTALADCSEGGRGERQGMLADSESPQPPIAPPPV